MNKIEQQEKHVSSEQSSDTFPTLLMQQSYLMGRTDSVELGGKSSHIYFEIKLSAFDTERAQFAWNALLKRHQTLRTRFNDKGEQWIADFEEYLITFSDYSVLDSEQKAVKLDALRQVMKVETLPLSDHLFDIRVSKLSQSEFIVHVKLDMLIADFSCLFILFEEFGQYYNDPAVKLPALEFGFREYVEAYNDMQKSDEYEAAKSYWLDRLPEFPGAPELPYLPKHEWPEHLTIRRHQFSLEPEKWHNLTQNAYKAGVSPTVLIMTAFAKLLSKWSSNNHFNINMTVMNRLPVHEQITSLLGDFTSTCLIETAIDSESSLIESAKKLNLQVRKDIKNKQFSGMEMLREMSRKHGKIGTLDMGVVFTSFLKFNKNFRKRNSWDESEEIHDYELNFTSLQTAQVAIDHQVCEFRDGHALVFWDVVEEIFPEGLINDMFAAYQQLILTLTEDSLDAEEPLKLPRLDKQLAKRAVLNGVQAPISGQLLHSGIEQQAKSAPDKLAIHTQNKSLTFGQLNRWANGLANLLLEKDVKPGELVAICMHKSWQQIVAALAILKAGAAYMPIDASLPKLRKHTLIEQGKCRILLAEPSVDMVEINHPALFSCVLEPAFLDTLNPASPEVTQDDSAIAYVLFTSGSTGVPKGVVIDHRGAVNTNEDINRRFGVTANDCVFGLSSLSFDLSVYDIFGVLGIGGSLVVPEPEDVHNQSSWPEYVEKFNVTVWNSVPALMQLFTQQIVNEAKNLSTLRLVLMSGDWIPPALPDQIRALSTEQCQIISLGGATEASIWSIFYEINHPTSHLPRIPYGVPLTNQQFHVLDKSFNPCPDWVTGDLYITGDGVAKGYWQDQEKTEKSFITFADGKTYYRTGDVGRYRNDGIIEILGREDNQVKVQGHRIELGEIEGNLQQHDKVKSAVVVVHEDEHQGKCLAAYYVPETKGNQVETERLFSDDPDKSLFILEQHSIRECAPTLPRIPVTENQQSALSLLTALRQYDVGETMPKYWYPSASSLYPVQCYVSVAKEKDGLETGLYYYSPKENAVIKLADTFLPEAHHGNHAEIAFLLCATMDSITPFYPAELAQELVALEAGYILQLLRSWANKYSPDLSLNWDIADENIDLGIPHQRWLLTARVSKGQLAPTVCDAAVLNDKTIALRKSFRRFSGEGATPEQIQRLVSSVTSESSVSVASQGSSILVYLKNSALGQWYTFNSQSQSLELIANHNESVISEHFTENNKSIFAACDFAIFYFSSSERNAALVSAGELGQRLLQLAPAEKMGICPIGTLAQTPVWPGDHKNETMIHCFLGGGLSEQQLSLTKVPDQQLNENELPLFLEQRLPHYMVPRIFMPLDELPLTPTGKVNRKALPEICLNHTQPDSVAAPENDTQRQLLDIWLKFIGNQNMGIHDNFFTAGGNSLIAMQILATIREVCGVDVNLRQLFENPTVAEFANAVFRGQQNGAAPEKDTSVAADAKNTIAEAVFKTGVVEQYPELTGQVFPMSLSQRKLFAFEMLSDNKTAYNIQIPILLDEHVTQDIAEEALGFLLNRHAALRTFVIELDNEPVQWVPSDLPLTVERLYAEQQAQMESLRKQIVNKPFVTGQEPLSRFALIRNNENHRLEVLICVHHLIADYISSELLQNEFIDICTALHNKTPIQLKAVATSFHEFVLAQKQFEKSSESESQLRYWQKQLGDLLPPKLPFAKTLNVNNSTAGAWQDVVFRQQDAKQLEHVSEKEGFTPFVFALAALHLVMKVNLGQSDIPIGTPISTRDRQSYQDVCGLMLNSLVMRIDSSHCSSRHELLKRTHNVVLEAFENKDLPYESMQQQVQWQNLSANESPYKVRFVFRTLKDSEQKRSKATALPISMDKTDCKFDLMFNINYQGDALFGDIEYQKDLFEESDIRILADQYVYALNALSSSENAGLQVTEQGLLKIKQEKLKELQKILVSKKAQLLETLLD